MARKRATQTQIGTIVMGLAGLVVVAGVGYALMGLETDASATSVAEKPADKVTTASFSAAKRSLGKSGLPLPRFVSLKTDRVNVRRGPSSEHQVSWVFTAKGMPVEIIAEFEHWRRIRDSEGEEGWIYQSLLAGRRTAVVAPWRKGNLIGLHAEPSPGSAPVAKVNAGVIGKVAGCNGNWCRLSFDGFNGWIDQTMLWGVYPGEQVSN